MIDTETGNLLKANRFGFVKRALHGTRPLEFENQRQTYSRTIVDLSEDRWVFLNTLFSLSEGCMYCQLVDLLDQRRLPEVLGYRGLYRPGEGDPRLRPHGGPPQSGDRQRPGSVRDARRGDRAGSPRPAGLRGRSWC